MIACYILSEGSDVHSALLCKRKISLINLKLHLLLYFGGCEIFRHTEG